MTKIPPPPHDDELSREVDELLDKLPAPEPGDEDYVEPAAESPSNSDESSASEVGDASFLDGTYPRAMVWGRVALGLALAVFMTQWPYTVACDFPLFLYLAAVTVTFVSGVWAGLWSWRRRVVPAHLLSLAVVAWSGTLATGSVLPRVGYAREAAAWRCATTEMPVVAGTRHVMTDVGYAPLGADSIFYASTGTGAPVVLVGGTSADHRQWDDLAQRLASDFRVIRFDAPGSGRSRDAGQPAASIDPLLAVFDALRLSRARVVGHSVGGAIAIDFTLAHPERVEALVLVGVQPSGSQAFTPFDQNRGQVTSLLLRDGVVGLSAFLLDNAYYAPEARRDADFRGRLEMFVRQNARSWTAAADSVALLGNGFGQLESVNVPVLVLKPELDFPDLVAMADTMTSRIPGAVSQAVPGVGHMVHMSAPDRLAALLRQALVPGR